MMMMMMRQKGHRQLLSPSLSVSLLTDLLSVSYRQPRRLIDCIVHHIMVEAEKVDQVHEKIVQTKGQG